LLPREKKSAERRGENKEGRREKRSSEVALWKGVLLSSKGSPKKAFSRLKIAFFNRDRRDGWKKKREEERRPKPTLVHSLYLQSSRRSVLSGVLLGKTAARGFEKERRLYHHALSLP